MIRDLQKKMDDINPSISLDETNEKIRDLQIQVNRHDNRIESMERNDRIGVLIIEGINFKKGKKLTQCVIDDLQKYLEYKLTERDFLGVINLGWMQMVRAHKTL